jgi:hypothetical protein
MQAFQYVHQEDHIRSELHDPPRIILHPNKCNLMFPRKHCEFLVDKALKEPHCELEARCLVGAVGHTDWFVHVLVEIQTQHLKLLEGRGRVCDAFIV